MDELESDELKGLISQVSGLDEDSVKRIAPTFNALVKLGDFSAEESVPLGGKLRDEASSEDEHAEDEKLKNGAKVGLRTEFHYNIQIHLPGNGSEETYLNIFNAFRRTFK